MIDSIEGEMLKKSAHDSTYTSMHPSAYPAAQMREHGENCNRKHYMRMILS